MAGEPQGGDDPKVSGGGEPAGQDGNKGQGGSQQARSPRTTVPRLPSSDQAFVQRPNVTFEPRSPTLEDQMSPTAGDRVFPIRSVVSVDPTPTGSAKPGQSEGGYFASAAHARRQSFGAQDRSMPSKPRQGSHDWSGTSDEDSSKRSAFSPTRGPSKASPNQRQPANYINEMIADSESTGSGPAGDSRSGTQSERPRSTRAASTMSAKDDDIGGLITARFKHVITE